MSYIVNMAERLPTEADADEDGMVWVRLKGWPEMGDSDAFRRRSWCSTWHSHSGIVLEDWSWLARGKALPEIVPPQWPHTRVWCEQIRDGRFAVFANGDCGFARLDGPIRETAREAIDVWNDAMRHQ